MASLAASPATMRRDREREGLRLCRAAWLVGVSVREYREIEAGDRTPSLDTYRRISELYGWAQTFMGQGVLVSPKTGNLRLNANVQEVAPWVNLQRHWLQSLR
jgi:transcriptional regulator with XRE-family HTH domain